MYFPTVWSNTLPAKPPLNGYTGTHITTLGAIVLSNVKGIDNVTYGAELINSGSTTHAPITVTGSTGGNVFNGNTDYGIRIHSKGAISLKNITADDNAGYGIYVNNYQSGAGVGNVTVSNLNLVSNHLTGLYITSNGAVTLNYIISMHNSGGNGTTIYSYDHNVLITNSVMIANNGLGIYADVDLGTFTMTNTLYFGNDTDNSGDPNIRVLH